MPLARKCTCVGPHSKTSLGYRMWRTSKPMVTPLDS